MIDKNKIKLFLVDDDPLFLKSLEVEFLSNGYTDIETFSTGELCLSKLSNIPDLIILDYHLDGIVKGSLNGIDTLDKIKETHPDIPVVLLSSQDRIEVAIKCMHHNAFDYVVKSETAFLRLQNAINTIFQKKLLENKLSWYMNRM